MTLQMRHNRILAKSLLCVKANQPPADVRELMVPAYSAGQVLVMHDMLGIYQPAPRFSRQFAPVGAMMNAALKSYVDAVQSRSFPAAEHTVVMDPVEWQSFQNVVADTDCTQPLATHPPRQQRSTEVAGLESDAVPPIRHVCIVGGGAMGSLLASKLNEVEGVSVTMLTRWLAHKAAIDSHGLSCTAAGVAGTSTGVVNAAIKTAACAEDVTEPVDLAIVAVKGHHTAAAAADCDAILSPDGGVVLTLQNGINHPRLQHALGAARTVIPGVTSHGATMEAPGSVVHAGEGRTEIGVLCSDAGAAGAGAGDNALHDDRHHHAVHALLNQAGFDTEVVVGTHSVEEMLWRKLLVNAVINPLTAILDVSNGALREPVHAGLIEALVAEISATATANGILLPADPLASVTAVLDGTASNVSSMLADVRRGDPTEIGQIAGPILAAAHDAAVPTPILRTLDALVRAKEEAATTAAAAAAQRLPRDVVLPSETGALPIVITKIAEMQATSRGSSGSVAFVPTMGGLHKGHLNLVRAARAVADVVVVSVFVNPTQFAADEDFDLYPRRLESDCAMLREAGADYVFAPTSDEMYPDGASASAGVEVDVGGIDGLSEGVARPGFFKGVATVCTKLFNAVQPDHVIFGQKDALQCMVIQRLVRNLAFPITVHIEPTVREHDGLAMSSRNARLTTEQRAEAAVVYRSLSAARDAAAAGVAGGAGGGIVQTSAVSVGSLKSTVSAVLDGSPAVKHVDYISFAHPTTGEEMDDGEIAGAGTVISTAVVLHGGDQSDPVRLLDNVVL